MLKSSPTPANAHVLLNLGSVIVTVRSIPKLLIPLLCAFLSLFSLSAQSSNPTAATCGLPAQGTIFTSATYTLSANCTQTGVITIATAPPEQPRISLTINGAGYTITGGNFSVFTGSGNLTLNNVTVDGANGSPATFIQANTLNASNVSFIDSNAPVSAAQSNLNNVLFSGFSSVGRGIGGNGNALHFGSGSSHSFTNVVLSNNYGSVGAVGLQSGASLTTNGCLTHAGNIPYDIYVYDGATWTDNSTGACTGTIGNGESAEIPAPALTACGLPAAGILDVSATYSLSEDCSITERILLSEGVAVTIRGNGHRISSSYTDYVVATAATASLTLERVALAGVRFEHWGDFLADGLLVTNTNDGMMYSWGEARIMNALFSGNTSTHSLRRSALTGDNRYGSGDITFTHVTFSGNSGGRGVLVSFGATIELNGCIHFENNSPVDTYLFAGTGAVLNDNRDTGCDRLIVDPLIPPLAQSLTSSEPDDSKPICDPHCHPIVSEKCDIQLGAIGLICRSWEQPSILTVWRARSNSEGVLLFGVSQTQVEAAEQGILACSPDGRAVVRLGLPEELRRIFRRSPKYRAELRFPRRYIIISKGPTDEGKVHHVVLDNAVDGRVFGTVDTYGGPPAQDCIPAPTPAVVVQSAQPTDSDVKQAAQVMRQPAQADGSIMHIVQPDDTISGISIAYLVSQREIIALNQLAGLGDLIYAGQELIIRAAS